MAEDATIETKDDRTVITEKPVAVTKMPTSAELRAAMALNQSTD